MTNPTTMTEPEPDTVDHALLGLAEIVLRGATSPHPADAEAFGWQMIASRAAGVASMALAVLAELAPDTAAEIARADAGPLGEGACPHAMARWVGKRVLAPRGVDVDQAYAQARTAAVACQAAGRGEETQLLAVHPAPWRIGQTDQVMPSILDANGCIVAERVSPEGAEAIVALAARQHGEEATR